MTDEERKRLAAHLKNTQTQETVGKCKHCGKILPDHAPTCKFNMGEIE